MKTYSLDLRSKIVTAHLAEKMSIRKVAIRFAGAQNSRPKTGKTTTTRG
jgi:transposase